MRVLIAIPLKTADGEYTHRASACMKTWASSSYNVGVKFFSDADFALDSSSSKIRQERMKSICLYVLQHGYDFLFRVDSDAYVWVDRLLTSGFENHDYMGNCLDYPPRLARHRTAHGGAGFTLSRRAMEIVVKAPHFTQGNPPTYWGDIHTGMVLFDAGIGIHRSERFKEGQGVEDLRPADLPLDHDYISVHPVTPQGMHEFQSSGSRK